MILWTIAIVSLSAITLSKRGISITNGEAPVIIDYNESWAETQPGYKADEAENAATFMFLLADAYEKSKMKEKAKSPQWLRFKR